MRGEHIPVAEDWGLPDWTDAAAYPDASASNVRWWWEFTRRDPAYRKLWLKWGPIKKQEILAEKKDWTDLALERFGEASLEPYLDRAPTDDPDGLRLRFEMSTLLNPAKVFEDWQLSDHRFPRNGTQTIDYSRPMEDALWMMENRDKLPPDALDNAIKSHKKRAKLDEEFGIVHYSIDLKQPVKPQLRQAEIYLQRVQSELYGRRISRPQVHKWPDYLRALDARESGATYAEIAEVLHRDTSERATQKGRDTVKNAEQVRDNFPL